MLALWTLMLGRGIDADGVFGALAVAVLALLSFDQLLRLLSGTSL